MTISLACHSRLLNPISLRLKGEKMQIDSATIFFMAIKSISHF
jgi:hypothetical protein